MKLMLKKNATPPLGNYRLEIHIEKPQRESIFDWEIYVDEKLH